LQVRTLHCPDGGVLHVLTRPASALPPVAKRDLEQAWEVAQGVRVSAPAARSFRFGPEPAVELRVGDRDAASWVAAVEGSIGLATPHGVSVCLRLLALVALMAQARWARGWFALERNGANIRSELWQAAALAPLNDAGGFDETALRALLPQTATQGLKT
jgi:hypothetical protein